ncbi:Ig and FN3 domain-containing protein, partial [Desulforamulus aeronauticus]
ILSDSATLTINPGTTDPVAPSITDQPQNQTVTIGQTATFTVTAAGSEPLNYQWKKDGIDIAGATSATLDIVNAQTSDAGIYTVEVSNDAGNIITDPATLTVNEPGDLNLLLTPGDRLVRLDWNEVPESVSYYVYQDTSYVQTVAGGVCNYEVTSLINGQTYTFEVRAIDDHDDVIATSGNHSTTPRTMPGTPTNVTATAGNGQATVSFSAPASNGGSPITGYTVTASPGNSTATGTSSPITVTGLSNGTSYTFTVKATNAAGNSAQSAPSNSVTPYKSSTGGSRGSSTPSTPPTSGVNVTVNGKGETIAAVDTTKVGGKTIITAAIDDQQLAERLKQEGRKAVVTIPVTTKADVVIGRLNGQIVKNMEGQEAILEITTNNVSYVLPAAQINIDSVSSQFGRQAELKDILIDVKIAASTLEARNNNQMVVDPVEFVITATNAGKTVESTKFNTYVERIIALPEGVDASKITTGVVFNRDGSFSHV